MVFSSRCHGFCFLPFRANQSDSPLFLLGWAWARAVSGNTPEVSVFSREVIFFGVFSRDFCCLFAPTRGLREPASSCLWTQGAFLAVSRLVAFLFALLAAAQFSGRHEVNVKKSV